MASLSKSSERERTELEGAADSLLGIPLSLWGCSSPPRRYMSILEGKTFDWKMPPVLGRNLHRGQLSVSLCATSGLVPQLPQFATNRELTLGEERLDMLWERQGKDPVGIHAVRSSAVGREVGMIVCSRDTILTPTSCAASLSPLMPVI